MSQIIHQPSRRQWLQATCAARRIFHERLVAGTRRCARTGNPATRRHCILLWMSGGPSQLDTFDPKPGHPNGGQFQAINTSAPGVRISQHLPRLSKLTQHMAILRGLSSKDGDHGRGTFAMRTGRSPDRVVRYPTLGSVISKELDRGESALPGFACLVNRLLASIPTRTKQVFWARSIPH